MEPVMRRGFVWGQIYIVLAIVFGLVGMIWGIMTLVGDTQTAWMMPAQMTAMAIVAIVFSALWLLSGIGLYGRWKWGLYLTYLLLFLNILAAIWRLVAYFTMAGLEFIPGVVAGVIIVFCIHVLIVCLYLGYFIRRRSWFH